ncbi:MAG: EAL domain-containing protein [Cyanobacteriota bacterium]|nr:EAL domain-containing protein [Cyanobacteriota bacterium]
MKKILVIEDEPDIRENIQDILEMEDFEILSARNGRIGLEQAQKHLPDLIVCDIMMPEMNGFEVLAELRKGDKTAAIPLIFLTAKADRPDFRQGMELGADDYLTKPFTPKELLQAITVRLEKKAQVEEKYQTKIQQISEQFNQQFYQDQVTGLPNRLSLREKFSQIQGLYQEQSEQKQLIAILCLSINRFSEIQSNLGYEKTDLLIKQVGEQLKSQLKYPAEILYLGSEEFAILLPPVSSKQTIIKLVESLQAQVNQAYQLDNQEVFLSCNIGISCYKQDGTEIDILLNNAKKALQQSQTSGTNNYEFYRVIFEVGKARKITLENELRFAIERNELELYYQPQISLKTNTIISAEALLRWNHPIRSIIPPNIFIPVAEEIGLINEIGEWVFNQACDQLKKWKEKQWSNLRMSINISAIQFNRANFRQELINSLGYYSILPSQIELELTETQLIQDIGLAQQRLKSLKSLGFSVAIDDFGKGYSSLKYLQQLAFDTLKIDRFFVQNIDSNSSNAAIAIATINMAHALNLKVVAEGVETQQELNVLNQYQCDAIQGYLFSRPLPVSKFESFLANWKRKPISR